MDKEYLLNRLRSLEQGKLREEQIRMQAEANYNAFLGAIQEINQQLHFLEQKELKEKENGKVDGGEAKENPKI
jgi:hypothetical protein